MDFYFLRPMPVMLILILLTSIKCSSTGKTKSLLFVSVVLCWFRGNEGLSASHWARSEGLPFHWLQTKERPLRCHDCCFHQGDHRQGLSCFSVKYKWDRTQNKPFKLWLGLHNVFLHEAVTVMNRLYSQYPYFWPCKIGMNIMENALLIGLL